MIEQIAATFDGVLIRAASRDGPANCSGCGTVSARVHSHYERTLADVENCERVTFVERVDGLTSRHARCSVQPRDVLQAIGLLSATLADDVL